MLVFAYTQSVNASVFAPERGYGWVRQRGTVQISVHYSDGCVTGLASGCDDEVPSPFAWHSTQLTSVTVVEGVAVRAVRLLRHAAASGAHQHT